MLNINQNIEKSNLHSIQTEIIRPIQISQQSATFVFKKIGNLDKHTRIVLAARASHDGVRYPLFTGCASLIRSAKLLSNGVEICSNDEVGQWVAFSNNFKSTQERENIIAAQLGIINTWKPSVMGANAKYNQNAARNDDQLGKIALSKVQYALAADNKTNTNTLATVGSGVMPNYQLTNDPNTTMRGYISLEQLFPFLYNGLQLPLQFINTEISLVIQFSSNGNTPIRNDRGCNNLARSGGIFSVNILTDECRMLCDYLHYKDNSAVLKEINSQEGMVLSYGDLDYNTFNMPGLIATPDVINRTKYQFNLGLTGKTLRQMYLFFPTAPQQEENADGHNYPTNYWKRKNPLLNKYCSPEISKLPDGFQYQIKVNGRNLYINPVSNRGEKLYRLGSAFGHNLEIPLSEYCLWDSVIDPIDATTKNHGSTGPANVGMDYLDKCLISMSATCNGHVQGECLRGTQNYVGVDLQKPVLSPSGELVRMDIPGSGTKIVNTPVFIDIIRDCPKGHDHDNRDMIVCSIVEKQAIIKNGVIQVINN